MIDPVTGEVIDHRGLAERLLAQATKQSASLRGPGGLLNQLTKNVLKTGSNAELTERLGHQHAGTPTGSNMRHRSPTKKVLTEIGPVEIKVVRARAGWFDPLIVPKRSVAWTDRSSRALPQCPRAHDRGDHRALRRGLRRDAGLQGICWAAWISRRMVLR